MGKSLKKILALGMLMLSIFIYNSIAFANSDLDYEIDANISNSYLEEDFNAEIETIRYLRDEKGLTFEEINTVLSQNRDIPYLDNFVGNHLNPQEKALYKENRAKALLCLSNGKYALDYSAAMYRDTYNGNGDAFRHAIWNYGMAIDVGQNFAKKWSDAHENGTKDNPYLEKKMDLFNNSVGLSLAKEYPNTRLHSDLKNKTRKAVRDGRCRIIVNNKLVRSNSNNEK